MGSAGMSPHRNGPRYDGAVRIGIGLCALAVTALLIRREFAPPQPVGDGRFEANAPPVRVPGWETALSDRPRIGTTEALVAVLEIGDFECPACRAYAPTLDSLLQRYPQEVAVYYLYWPLRQHRFALAAARAADCADAQGTFERMHRVLYVKQDSFGLKPWTQYAAEAGVPDVRTFAECAESVQPVSRIARDTLLARELGARGTPTIVVNGLRWSRPPPLAVLDSIIVMAKQTRR